MRRDVFLALTGAAAAMPSPAQAQSVPQQGTRLPDLRFGFAPLPASNAAQGYDPAGDAKALILAGTPSPATAPIPGTQTLGSFGPGSRYVIRVPDAWNGKLVVAGTPATRSEFANDAIWSDFALAHGYAFASSNKGIPYNAILEPASSSVQNAYVVPFDVAGLETKGMAFRFGVLSPAPIPISRWNDDYAMLVRTAQAALRTWRGKAPARTYAVGLSNGGAQVRTLLERHPDLVDGGVEWSAVYWSPETNFLAAFPVFIDAMNTYIASGFRDTAAADRIRAVGFPDDRLQPGNTAHPSLWADYYSNVPPFYADLTLFAYATLIDPNVRTGFTPPVCRPNAANPTQLPGTCAATGISSPQGRATYHLSDAAKRNIATFAHTGRIGKPLVSIAGTADAFITPVNNAIAYRSAVRAAGRADRFWQYLVDGGTHVDTFAAFGYGLQPQLPFAWAAFAQLEAIVEQGAHPEGAGHTRTVRTPDEIVRPAGK